MFHHALKELAAPPPASSTLNLHSVLDLVVLLDPDWLLQIMGHARESAARSTVHLFSRERLVQLVKDVGSRDPELSLTVMCSFQLGDSDVLHQACLVYGLRYY